MDDISTNSSIYQAGGSLSRGFPTYVQREADEKIFQHILAGDFCFVLAARQMGKSSMRVRTMGRIQKDSNYICASVDLTSLGSQSTNPDQWYYSFLLRISRGLRIQTQFKEWWGGKSNLTPVMRLADYFEEIVIKSIDKNVVIFIDEIDSLLSLDRRKFSTDDFFAFIRQTFNARADNPDYYRLRFVILGVATPHDLMQDVARTPFNIGVPILLENFNYKAAKPLLKGFSHIKTKGEKLLREILKWSGGQPYLSQRLCKEIAMNESEIEADKIEEVVEKYVKRIFLSPLSVETDHNLANVSKRITKNKKYDAQMLGLYEQILSTSNVEATGTDRTQIYLKLTGLVIEKKGVLVVANRIYREKFNRDWLIHILERINRPYSKELNLWLKSGKSAQAINMKPARVSDIHLWSSKRHDLSVLEKEFIDDIIQYDRIKQTKQKRVLSRSLVISVIVIFIVGFLGYLAVSQRNAANKYAKEVKEREIDLLISDSLHKQLADTLEVKNVQLIHRNIQIQLARDIANRNERETKIQHDKAVRLGKSMSYTNSANIASETNPTYGFNLALKAIKFDNNEAAQNILYKIYSENSFYDSIFSIKEPSFCITSPNNNRLITGVLNEKSALWSLSGKMIKEFPKSDFLITNAAFSLSGDTLLTVEKDKGTFWDTKGKMLNSFAWPKGYFLISSKLANNGMFLAVKKEKIYLFNSKGEQKICFSGHAKDVSIAIISSTGRYMASSTREDGTIIVWAIDGTKKAILKGHDKDITALAFSKNDKLLVSGSTDKKATIWKLTNLSKKNELLNTSHTILEGHNKNVSALAFSPDEKYCFTGFSDGTIRMWDLNGNVIKIFKGQKAKIMSIACRNKGNSFHTVSVNGNVFKWNYNGFIKRVIGNASDIYTASISRKGLIATGDVGKNITIRSVDSTFYKSFKVNDIVTALNFSPTNSSIVAGTKSGDIIRSGFIS